MKYTISLEQIRQSSKLTEMLADLEKGFNAFDIDFYLVGAISRDVWMQGVHRIAPKRITIDVDFAVLINDKGVYEKLREYLATQANFTAPKENAFVLIHQNGTEVDLLPFGEVSETGQQLDVEGNGFTNIYMDGLWEVYAEPLPEADLEGQRFKFCSLPGIVLLKLIAWDDRPEHRRDDILDVSHILNNYSDMQWDTMIDHHNDLFIGAHEDLEVKEIGAIVLGRELKRIAARNGQLYQRIQQILDKNSQDPATSRMAEIMFTYYGTSLTHCTGLVDLVRQGFQTLLH